MYILSLGHDFSYLLFSAANLRYFQTSSLPNRVSADVKTIGAYPTLFALIVSTNFCFTDSATFPGFFCEEAFFTFLSALVFFN